MESAREGTVRFPTTFERSGRRKPEQAKDWSLACFTESFRFREVNLLSF